MTEGQKEAILNRLLSADADAIAEVVRSFPDTPLYGIFAPVHRNPVCWADTVIEADKHADMAEYLRALAWFYAAVRPTDALRSLITAKLRVVKNGQMTQLFWEAMERAS